MDPNMSDTKAVVRVKSVAKTPKSAVKAKPQRTVGPTHRVIVPSLWVPKLNAMLVVELPGERLPTLVRQVVSPDCVIVELDNTPLMTKLHRYEKGDLVPCERINTPLETLWRAFRPAATPSIEPVVKPKARRKRKNAS